MTLCDSLEGMAEEPRKRYAHGMFRKLRSENIFFKKVVKMPSNCMSGFKYRCWVGSGSFILGSRGGSCGKMGSEPWKSGKEMRR